MEKISPELREYRLKEEDDDLHSQALVWNSTVAFVDSMVLKCAVKLRLFDAIHRHGGARPISLPELAAALSVSSNRLSVLHRIVRYLAHMGLVDAHKEDSYTLTPASSTYLREGSEKSHAPLVKFLVEEDMFAGLHMLDTCLSGEKEASLVAVHEKAGGEDVFELAARDPVVNKRFNEGMMCTVGPVIEAVLKESPEVFQGVNVLVDVAGGYGVVATAIARAFPSMRCIVYDLPHVVKAAPKSEVVEFEAGDMFVSVPRADAVLIARTLHDFNDEKALQILTRCREAIIDEKGKLILIESIISENDSNELNHVNLACDILMMAYHDGKERTEKEWRSLILKAGFSYCNIKRVKCLKQVIEARP